MIIFKAGKIRNKKLPSAKFKLISLNQFYLILISSFYNKLHNTKAHEQSDDKIISKTVSAVAWRSSGPRFAHTNLDFMSVFQLLVAALINGCFVLYVDFRA